MIKKKPGFTIGIDKFSLRTAELRAKRLKEELDLNTDPKPSAEFNEEAKKLEVKFQNKIDPGN